MAGTEDPFLSTKKEIRWMHLRHTRWQTDGSLGVVVLVVQYKCDCKVG